VRYRVVQQRHLYTSLFDRFVFDGYIGKVARGLIWKQRGDARLASAALLCGWGSRAPEGGGLARAWTTPGPKVPRHQCPDEAPGGAEGTRGQWTRNSAFASFLLLLLTTIFAKYINTKIEANLLKSVAYITPDMHVPLFKQTNTTQLSSADKSNTRLPWLR